MNTRHSGLRRKCILFAAVVLLAGTALADSNKGSLELEHPTSVAGKQMAMGNYIVRWDGTGDQVQLKLYRGKDEVASAPARMVKLDHRASNNSAVVNANSDGSYSLSQIRFGGKDYALEIVSDGGSSSSGAASR